MFVVSKVTSNGLPPKPSEQGRERHSWPEPRPGPQAAAAAAAAGAIYKRSILGILGAKPPG